MSDVAAWRAVAEKATPGVWKLWGMTVMADQDGTSNYDTAVGVAQTYRTNDEGKPRTWDATHIATFDPPTMAAILDRLEAAEAAVARAEALVATDGVMLKTETKIVRVTSHRRDLGCDLTESMVRVDDLRAAIAGTPA